MKDKSVGNMTVKAMPNEMGEIQQWLNNMCLKLVYRGEGLPKTAQKVLLHLFAKKNSVYT